MSATPDEAPAAGPEPGRPARWRWQFGLRDVVLLVVVAALVASTRVNRRRLDELAPRVEQLRRVVRTMDVADPRRFAAVRRTPDFHGDEVWDVHVPDGGEFRLCLAARGVAEQGVATPSRTTPIAPGRHRLTLVTRQDAGLTRFTVYDGAERRFVAEEPDRWVAPGGQAPFVSTASLAGPADRPFVLSRHLEIPGRGALLWIEPAGGKPTDLSSGRGVAAPPGP